MIKQEIINAIKPVLSGITQINDFEGLVDKPLKPEMGDYSFACFKLAKALKKSPDDVAKQIAGAVETAGLIEKVQAVGGYVNFFVNANRLAGQLLSQITENYGKSGIGNGKAIVIDYSSPNIAKPFGIGHLRSTVIGNALYKIYTELGYKCVGINFLGDWGTQFGMLIADYKANKSAYDDVLGKGLSVRYISAFLAERYVDYNERTKNEHGLLDAARAEFKKLENDDATNQKLWQQFRERSIVEFDRLYKLLNINFRTTYNKYSGESEVRVSDINKTIDEMTAKGLTKISEGALIVDLEPYGMPPCLLRKSDGATLYAARDIAAAIHRYDTYKFHKLIYVVGSDQKLHFRQIFKVLELMGYDWAKDCVHVDFGLVHFKGEKMSTRRGSTVLLEDVLNETIELSKKTMQSRQPDIQDKIKPGNIGTVAKNVGIGAVIFNDLKNKRIKDVDFDWDQILSFDGETGPYLMYTHTRLASLIKKSGKDTGSDIDFKQLKEPDEITLIKRLEEFPDIIMKSADEYEPSIISNYLLNISSIFNRYYHYHRIISDDAVLTSARIDLCKRLKYMLQQGLTLLGITPIEEM